MSRSAKINPPKIQRLAKAKKITQPVDIKSKTQNLPRRKLKTSSIPEVRTDSKLSNMIALMRRQEGATIEQLTKETGWQRHSVRGAMSGTIKKKLGLIIASSKVDGVRAYRIATAGSA